MFMKKLMKTALITGLVILGTAGLAQAGEDDPQITAPPQYINTAAGGFGKAILYAFVAADGSHVAGTGGYGLVSTSQAGTGVYTVRFRRNVNINCVYLPGMSRRATATDHGLISAVSLAGDPTGLYIQTFDVDGTPADKDFAVMVNCHQ